MTSMKPGLDLDALIATHVMGCRRLIKETREIYSISGKQVETDYSCDCDVDEDHFIRYSTDIAAAWEIVEHLQPKYNLSLNFAGDWECQLSLDTLFLSSSKTAPHAICLAALKAVGVKID